jgi:hypothetical protein
VEPQPKTAPDAPREAPANDNAQSSLGCVARLTWLLGGNVALGMLALTILETPPWKLTVADLLFWLAVAGVIGIRYVDVARLGGTTSSGEPATHRHFSRYAVRFATVWTLAWAGAQSIQYPS